MCFEPVFSSGSRDFRVLDPTVDRARQLLDERPGPVAMRLEEAVELLPDDGGPDLLVMELARRRAHRRRHRGGPPDRARPREDARGDPGGLAMHFVTLDDPMSMELADLAVAELEIDWFFDIRLVGGLVIEVNPRSTVVGQEDLDVRHLGVERARAEISHEELVALRARVRAERKALRYLDQVEWD